MKSRCHTRARPGGRPRAALALTLLFSPLFTFATLSAAKPHTMRIVHFEARDALIKAYFAQPSGRGPHSGIVVIHEWWGLNDQIRGVADRLAEIGYMAIVPDLYRGKRPTDSGMAHELMRGLNEDWAVDVITGAADYLRSIDGATDRPVGTIGFCMGGRLSLATALQGANIQATVMFYGSVETDPKSLKPLEAPLLGLFGGEDRGIPVSDVKKFEAALEKTGKTATILVYPGAGHAFFNEERPGYNREASRDAWARTKAFLTEHLEPRRAEESRPERAGSQPER